MELGERKKRKKNNIHGHMHVQTKLYELAEDLFRHIGYILNFNFKTFTRWRPQVSGG
jgi:hypothetical protein